MESYKPELRSVLNLPLRTVNNLGVVKELREQISAPLAQELVILLNNKILPISWKTYKNKGSNKTPSSLLGQLVNRIEERSGY